MAYKKGIQERHSRKAHTEERQTARNRAFKKAHIALHCRAVCSRILVFRVWPWYSSWKIRVRQSCTPKNQLQVAKYDETYTVFFMWLIRTYGLVVRWVAESRASWVWFLMSAKSFCPASAILRGTEPVSALTRALFILLRSLYFFSWISSVAISRWQSCKSWHDHPTCTVLENLN